MATTRVRFPQESIFLGSWAIVFSSFVNISLVLCLSFNTILVKDTYNQFLLLQTYIIII